MHYISLDWVPREERVMWVSKQAKMLIALQIDILAYLPNI